MNLLFGIDGARSNFILSFKSNRIEIWQVTRVKQSWSWSQRHLSISAILNTLYVGPTVCLHTGLSTDDAAIMIKFVWCVLPFRLDSTGSNSDKTSVNWDGLLRKRLNCNQQNSGGDRLVLNLLHVLKTVKAIPRVLIDHQSLWEPRPLFDSKFKVKNYNFRS